MLSPAARMCISRKLSAAMGMPELAEDPLYIDTESRKKNADSLKTIIEQWASDKTAAQCVEIIEGAGVPAGPIYNCADVCNDKNIVEVREMLVKVPHKEAGELTVLGNPVKMDRYPCHYEKAAPDLGEDNECDLYGVLDFPKKRWRHTGARAHAELGGRRYGMDYTEKIEIAEVCPRDGWQNHPVPIDTETKIELIRKDDGLRS